MQGKPTYVFIFAVPSRRVPPTFSQYDYTNGQLDELLDVIIDSRAALFVSAVGVPPKAAVDKLHAAGISVMKRVPLPSGQVPDTNRSANAAWLDTPRCVGNIHYLV